MAAINPFRRSVVPVSKLIEKLLFSARSAPVAASRPFCTSVDRGPDDATTSHPDELSLISEDIRPVMDNNSGDTKGPADLHKGVHPVWLVPVFTDTTGLVKLRDMTEDDEVMQIRIDFPGLGKEDLEVTAEHNKLIIGGKGLPCRCRFSLMPERYRMDQIRAKMKDGMLKIVVPKVKEEKHKDVFKVPVK